MPADGKKRTEFDTSNDRNDPDRPRTKGKTMTDKELRRLHREDLLQILIAQQRQIDELNAALEESEAALNEKKIAVQEAGSVAEAALKLSGVFEAAQQAADLYAEEMRARADEIVAQAKAEAEQILNRARREVGLPQMRAEEAAVSQPQPQEPEKRRGGLFRRKG